MPGVVIRVRRWGGGRETVRVVDEGPPSVEDSERATLVAFLEYLRARIVVKLEGVDDEAARRSNLPSGTSIYWLGTHLSAVEINQFQRILDGRSPDRLVPPPPPGADKDRMTDVITRYAAATAESRAILDTFHDLDAVGRGVDRRTGERRTARWVLVHMIEETARHAGHLDILREELDGAAGR
jgi:hypothetical protein